MSQDLGTEDGRAKQKGFALVERPRGDDGAWLSQSESGVRRSNFPHLEGRCVPLLFYSWQTTRRALALAVDGRHDIKRESPPDTSLYVARRGSHPSIPPRSATILSGTTPELPPSSLTQLAQPAGLRLSLGRLGPPFKVKPPVRRAVTLLFASGRRLLLVQSTLCMSVVGARSCANGRPRAFMHCIPPNNSPPSASPTLWSHHEIDSTKSDRPALNDMWDARELPLARPSRQLQPNSFPSPCRTRPHSLDPPGPLLYRPPACCKHPPLG